MWKADFGRFWPDTDRFHVPLAGITPITRQVLCVDRRRQWKHFRNWRRSSALYPVTRPFRRGS